MEIFLAIFFYRFYLVYYTLKEIFPLTISTFMLKKSIDTFALNHISAKKIYNLHVKLNEVM